jgi:UDP:flavonoid glycosyltransferase YjiC (YdhE family)
MRTRVLFFGEPVTLAHVARPLALARALDPAKYDVALATGAAYRAFVTAEGLSLRELYSVGGAFFLDAVARGRPVFPYAELERYVDDDLAHIRDWRPDVVVGDFRISLAVSARLARVPYVAIANAYWSPFARPRFEIPVHPASRLLGPDVASALFRAVRPAVFAQHSLPMHRLRRAHGMPSLGFDLRRVFTEGDTTLFADVPELVPSAVPGDGGRYRYLGPVTWSPRRPVPDRLADPSDTRPLVYLTLGSSGDPGPLLRIVAGLSALDCRIAVATAGVVPISALPARVVAADFLPGDAVTAQAQLVVCNGGSLTCQQALAHGVPVLGIPANLDQLLNMHYMVGAGAALSVRPERLDADQIRGAGAALLEVPGFRSAAQRLAAVFRGYDAHATLSRALDAAAHAPPQ